MIEVRLVRNKELYQLCREAITAVVVHVQKLVAEQQPIGRTTEYKAVVKSGVYRGRLPHHKLDWVGFISSHLPEMLNLKPVVGLSDFLKDLISDYSKPIKNRKIVSDYLETLFFTYTESKSFPRFDENSFLEAYSLLEQFMYGDLKYHSYAPLYSFDMETEKITLDNGLVIRKIRSENYSDMDERGVPASDLVWLKCLVEYNSTLESYEQRKDELKYLILALRLFKSGAVGYNTVYTKPALGEALGRSSMGSTFGRPLSGQNYFLNRKEAHGFRLFYSNFCKNIHRIINQKFLQIAIDRFTSALEEWKQEERIIDFTIALEAMFSTSSEDLTYKLSIRASVFLANNDEEAKFFFNFIKKAYKVRSKLVHGKVNSISLKAFIISGKNFGYADTSRELERIVRLSIIKYLNFLNDHKYKSHEDVIEAIDIAAVGSTKKVMKQKSSVLLK